VVSIVRGRWQRPILEWVTRCLLMVAVLGALVPGSAGRSIAVVGVAVVIGVPLGRVGWLVGRWWHERDWGFVVIGAAVLAVVAVGVGLAAAGVGL
jgi:hypothetical protein